MPQWQKNLEDRLLLKGLTLALAVKSGSRKCEAYRDERQEMTNLGSCVYRAAAWLGFFMGADEGLRRAAMFGQTQTLKRLLEAGAHINAGTARRF